MIENLEYALFAIAALGILTSGVLAQKYLNLMDEYNDLVGSAHMAANGEGEFVIIGDEVAFAYCVEEEAEDEQE